MKLSPPASRPQKSQHGSTVLIALALLGIMTAMITADFIAVRGVDRELKLIEKRQIRRLTGQPPAAKPPGTNSPAARQN